MNVARLRKVTCAAATPLKIMTHNHEEHSKAGSASRPYRFVGQASVSNQDGAFTSAFASSMAFFASAFESAAGFDS